MWQEPGGEEAPTLPRALDIEVKSVEWDGQEVFLSARGGWTRTEMMERAAAGVCRILRSAA